MRKLFLILGLLLSWLMSSATHNRAGEITFRHLSGLTYEITINIFSDPTSPAFQRREIEINYGDNTGLDSIAQTTVYPKIKDNIQQRSWVTQHTFPGPGNYNISVTDPNRNGGVDNIDNSSAVPFYLETLLRISPISSQANNSPQLLNDPIDDACAGQLFIHNPGAYDPDGDSLAYEISASKGDGGALAPGYTFPDNMTVDAETGDLIWNTPNQIGLFNVAIVIKEYRNGVLLGSILRDLQIQVFPGCNNRPPDILADQLHCVEAEKTIVIPIQGVDPNNQDVVKLTATGAPFEVTPSPAMFNTNSPSNPTNAGIVWNTVCSHVKFDPYNASIKAEDNGDARGSLVLTSFKTIGIRVVAPAPQNFQADVKGAGIDLSWDNSACTSAVGYKLYRRIDSSGFVADSCVTGVPDGLGYNLIHTEENIGVTNYLDDNNGEGLIPGLKYCYLIIAYFEDGSESYASTEVCGEIEKVVPVITNVSVNNTSINNGEIQLSWSPPDTIDQSTFPPPYRYLIYKTETGGGQTLIDSTLSFIDTNYLISGVNTEEEQFRYKVQLYSYGLGKQLAGSSFPASSVYLNISPSDNVNLLDWNVNVPWSNQEYTIFRLHPDSASFDSIATVNITEYTDQRLSNNRNYCYYIRAKGSYNLSSVKSPLINLSQINCSVPIDNVPPCEVSFEVESDCDSNQVVIRWNRPTVECEEDIVYYEVYRSLTKEGNFELLQRLSAAETEYKSNFNSIAGCYRVLAIDSAENRSQTEVRKCIDFCPVYELPNIFTPNGDGVNDLFIPLPYRYVDSIDLKIYNRWGGLVFESDDPDIKWTGEHIKEGKMVSDGVYYYTCIVYELSLDGLKPRLIKGTVNVQDSGNSQEFK